MVNLDTALWFAGIVALAAVVALLFYKRVWHVLPFFCAYSAWTLIGGLGAYAVRQYWPAAYLTTFVVEECLDNTLQFCVLVELAWSILRPFRSSLPRGTVWVLGILIACAGAAIWPFADSSAFSHYPLQWHLLFHLRQTVSVLRILFFLLLAASSQLLSIGWRDRELQVATGLGFYSLVAITTTVLHSYKVADAQYRVLDQLLVASYVCSLAYWAVCFAQQEAERREFSPQMQSMLMAVAGAAHSSRTALAAHAPANSRKSDEP